MTDVMISAPRRPETEVTEKASRRRFGAEYKRRILREAAACTERGALGHEGDTEAVFLEKFVVDLGRVSERVDEVASLHLALFDEFPDVEQKRAARTKWLRAGEAAGVLVELLEEHFPQEAIVVRETWTTLDEEEDTHTTSDATSVAADAADMAKRRFRGAHLCFRKAAALAFRTARAESAKERR